MNKAKTVKVKVRDWHRNIIGIACLILGINLCYFLVKFTRTPLESHISLFLFMAAIIVFLATGMINVVDESTEWRTVEVRE